MQGIQKLTLKTFYFFLFFAFLGITSVQAIKSAAIVMCAETGSIHHEQNADAITHPASLTKMMTLYLTFKAIKENRLTYGQHLPVSKHASNQAPSKLGLRPGNTITVRQAILALVTKSANDAAVVLAEALGRGSEAQFAQCMTKQARVLGMSKTVFKNASGLPNKHQVTTARDMATLSQSLYKHFPKEFTFFKEQNFTFKGQTHRNHNHLLGKVKGVDGIKTGFINASGFNLAASMVRDNKRIIAVVMGGPSAKLRDKKMVQLLEATHKTIKKKTPSQNPGKYASIGDLIHTLGPSEAYAAPLQTPLQNATYLTEEDQVQTFEEELGSLDDLLDVIETKPAKAKIIKAKAGASKNKVKSNSKKQGKIIKAKGSHHKKTKNKSSTKKKRKRNAV